MKNIKERVSLSITACILILISVTQGVVIESASEKRVWAAHREYGIYSPYIREYSADCTEYFLDDNAVSALEDTVEDKSVPEYLKQYKSLISNKCVIIVPEDGDAAEIYKEKDKSSKTAGYAVNNCVADIEEEDDGWYLIKSGKITGYIQAKYVVAGDDAETEMLESGLIKVESASKNTAVSIKGKSGKSKMSANKKYTVILFKNNYEKIKIKYGDNVYGWVSVKNVEFKLSAPKAMSKKKYDKYILKEQIKKEKEYAKAADYAGSFNGSLNEIIISMLAHNESGNYTAARNRLSQYAGEKTITVGAWQWYGERAHNLIRRIVQYNETKMKKIMYKSFSGSVDKKEKKTNRLYNDIIGTESWETEKRKFSREELLAVKSILGSSEGIKFQKEQVAADVQTRINLFKNTYKITNTRAIAYLVDLHWQSPESARSVLKKALSHYSSKEEFNKDKDALVIVHKEAVKNKTVGGFSSRRMYTYAVCSKIKTTLKQDTEVKKTEGKISGEKETKKSKKEQKKQNGKNNKSTPDVQKEKKEYATEAVGTTAAESVTASETTRAKTEVSETTTTENNTEKGSTAGEEVTEGKN